MCKPNAYSLYTRCKLMEEEEEKLSSNRQCMLYDMPSFLNSMRGLRILLCVGQLLRIDLLRPVCDTVQHLLGVHYLIWYVPFIQIG